MQSMSYSDSDDADASLLHLLHMLEHYFYLSQTPHSRLFRTRTVSM